MLDEAMKDGYQLGRADTAQIVKKYDSKMAEVYCELGADGLADVRRYRQMLQNGHDPRNIAKAVLILLETYAELLIERGMKNLEPEHLPAA